jgi:cell division protein FtsB
MSTSGKRKRRLTFFILAFLILCYLYFFGSHGYFALRKLEHRSDSLKIVEDSLIRELENIETKIKQVQAQNPEVIDEEARRLGMAKSSEELIIVQIDSSMELQDKVRK